MKIRQIQSNTDNKAYKNKEWNLQQNNDNALLRPTFNGARVPKPKRFSKFITLRSTKDKDKSTKGNLPSQFGIVKAGRVFGNDL
eukprot:Pgem_evm1s14996